MIRKIITLPDPRLRTKCEEIIDFGKDIQQLVEDLLDTMRDAKDPEGAGLAATQLGVNKKICVVRDFSKTDQIDKPEELKEYVLINPVIITSSKEKEIDWEACFSVPDLFAMINRPKKIKMEAYDMNGKKFKLNASGFFARVIQHEIDHLNGILFIDKAVGKILNQQQFDKITKGSVY